MFPDDWKRKVSVRVMSLNPLDLASSHSTFSMNTQQPNPRSSGNYPRVSIHHIQNPGNSGIL